MIGVREGWQGGSRDFRALESGRNRALERYFKLRLSVCQTAKVRDKRKDKTADELTKLGL